MGVDNARKTVRAGFTTVHNVGNFRPTIDIALRDAINAGRVPGLRMAEAVCGIDAIGDATAIPVEIVRSATRSIPAIERHRA